MSLIINFKSLFFLNLQIKFHEIYNVYFTNLLNINLSRFCNQKFLNKKYL